MYKIEFKCTNPSDSSNSVTGFSITEELTAFDELVSVFERFALAMGYHQDTINDYLKIND